MVPFTPLVTRVPRPILNAAGATADAAAAVDGLVAVDCLETNIRFTSFRLLLARDGL
jgi:hypothetical protein